MLLHPLLLPGYLFHSAMLAQIPDMHLHHREASAIPEKVNAQNVSDPRCLFLLNQHPLRQKKWNNTANFPYKKVTTIVR